MQATEHVTGAPRTQARPSPGPDTGPGRPAFRFSDLWRAPLHDMPIRDEILYQYMPLAPDKAVLEVGPGSGFTAFRLARRVRKLTLVDVGAAQVEHLKQTFAGVGNVSLVCADVCAPDLARQVDPPYDAAFAIEVFELLPDPDAALRNFAEVLRPDGVLMLQFPNYPPPLKLGVTYFPTRQRLDDALGAAGFRSWDVWSLRLRPFANAIFKELHERPLNLYRRLRSSNGGGRLDYEATWAFNQRHRLEPYKYVVHAAWEALLATARLRGPCFERQPLPGEILGHNLLVMARR